MIDFGLRFDIDHYVSISSVAMETVLKNIGWPPKRLGETALIGNDLSAGEIFEVSDAALQKVLKVAGIPARVLPEC